MPLKTITINAGQQFGEARIDNLLHLGIMSLSAGGKVDVYDPNGQMLIPTLYFRLTEPCTLVLNEDFDGISAIVRVELHAPQPNPVTLEFQYEHE